MAHTYDLPADKLPEALESALRVAELRARQITDAIAAARVLAGLQTHTGIASFYTALGILNGHQSQLIDALSIVREAYDASRSN